MRHGGGGREQIHHSAGANPPPVGSFHTPGAGERRFHRATPRSARPKRGGRVVDSAPKPARSVRREREASAMPAANDAYPLRRSFIEQRLGAAGRRARAVQRAPTCVDRVSASTLACCRGVGGPTRPVPVLRALPSEAPSTDVRAMRSVARTGIADPGGAHEARERGRPRSHACALGSRHARGRRGKGRGHACEASGDGRPDVTGYPPATPFRGPWARRRDALTSAPRVFRGIRDAQTACRGRRGVLLPSTGVLVTSRGVLTPSSSADRAFRGVPMPSTGVAVTFGTPTGVLPSDRPIRVLGCDPSALHDPGSRRDAARSEPGAA